MSGQHVNIKLLEMHVANINCLVAFRTTHGCTNMKPTQNCTGLVVCRFRVVPQMVEKLYITCTYTITFLKWPFKKKTKIGFQDRLSLNAGQKYCRMLQEHSAILLTFNKLPFTVKTYVLSIFE